MSTAILEPTGTAGVALQHPSTPGTEAHTEALAPAYVMPPTTNPVMRALLRGPLLMGRLGLKSLLGRGVMILTTTGRKSGLPRHTPIGFHTMGGRKYAFTLRGPGTDWYRNMAADPHVTVQTVAGVEPVLARRVTDDEEVWAAYDFLAPMPAMKQWAVALGIDLTREELVAHKNDFILITFDPTTEPTPPPLRADLVWVWFVAVLVPAAALAIYTLARRR